MKPSKTIGQTFATLTAIVAALALHVQASEVVADSFKSSTLERDYRMQVYLPDGYNEKSQAYPVIYLLHGAGGNESSWTATDSVKETLDALIKRGSMRPTIAVRPGGGILVGERCRGKGRERADERTAPLRRG